MSDNDNSIETVKIQYEKYEKIKEVFQRFESLQDGLPQEFDSESLNIVISKSIQDLKEHLQKLEIGDFSSGNIDGLAEATEKILKLLEKETGDGSLSNQAQIIHEEAVKLKEAKKAGKIQIPRDLWRAEFSDSPLLLVEDEKKKDKIKKLQEKGELLWGTLEGLAGGGPRFKLFTIALARTLNEQSNFYQINNNTGVPIGTISPKGLLSLDSDVYSRIRRSTTKPIPPEIQNSPLPHVIINYEKFTRIYYGKKKVGGKETKEMREYFQSLNDKCYLVEAGEGFFKLPFITWKGAYTDSNIKEKDAVYELSPLFVMQMKDYISLRADTIQLLRKRGGKQRDITFALLDFLIEARGIVFDNTKKHNGGPGQIIKSKKELLKQIGKNKTYEGRPGRLNKEFLMAVERMVDAKLLLPGTTKTGELRGYQEIRGASGEVQSVFNFNPNYFEEEGESQVDEQPKE